MSTTTLAPIDPATSVSPLSLRPTGRSRSLRPSSAPLSGPRYRVTRPTAPRDPAAVSPAAPHRSVADLASDDTTLRRGAEALTGTGVSSLGRLQLRVVEEQLRVAGVVKSYYHKQLVTESLRPTLAGRRLVNDVAVG